MRKTGAQICKLILGHRIRHKIPRAFCKCSFYNGDLASWNVAAIRRNAHMAFLRICGMNLLRCWTKNSLQYLQSKFRYILWDTRGWDKFGSNIDSLPINMVYRRLNDHCKSVRDWWIRKDERSTFLRILIVFRPAKSRITSFWLPGDIQKSQ